MAIIISDDFESGGTWGSTAGAWATSTTQANRGTHSARSQSTGVANDANWVITGAKTFSARFYVFIATDASGSSSVFQCDNANGNGNIQLRPGLKFRATLGGTNGADSAAVTQNAWHRIDVKIDYSGATATVDFSIDGSAQTQVTHAQTSANCTNVKLGNTGTNTYDCYFDDFVVTDSLSNHPIGSSAVSPAAGNAAGTGSATGQADKIQPNAGSISGTGAVGATIANVGAAGGAITRTGQAFGPDSFTSSPSIAVSTGTGASNAPVASISVNGGAITSTGTSYAPASLSVSPGPTVASATGTSYDPRAAAGVAVAAGVASGTGHTFSGISDLMYLYVGLVTGTAAAYTASVVAAANQHAFPTAASGTGAGNTPHASMAVYPEGAPGQAAGALPETFSVQTTGGLAAGTGTAPDAVAATFIVASADVATGTGASFDPDHISVLNITNANAAPLFAFGNAFDGGAFIEAPIDFAAGTVEVPTPLLDIAASIELVTLTGSAGDAVAWLRVPIGFGSAAGAAFNAFVTASADIHADVATGTGVVTSATVAAVNAGIGTPPATGRSTHIKPHRGRARSAVPVTPR